MNLTTNLRRDWGHRPRGWGPVAWVPFGAAVVSACVAIWLSGRTAIWRDEYATALYRALTAGDLWAATSHVDAVHYPYYLLMHWLSPLLDSDAAMRIPSIIAFSAATAVVTLVAARWWGAVAAAVAGIAFIANPLMLGAAVLARSYMLSILAVTLAILALDVAVRGLTRTGIGGCMSWLGYGLAAVAAVLLQPFALLSIGATVVLTIGRRRDMFRWALATLPASIATLAVLARARGQSAQLSWLRVVTPRDAVGNTALASGAAVGRGISLDVLALMALAVMTILAFLVSSAAQRRSLATAAALAFGPPAILYAISVLVTPVLTGRYLSWVAIGAALLLAGSAHTALHASRYRAAAAVTGALAAILFLPLAMAAHGTLHPPVRLDNFPGVVARLQAGAREGDLLMVVQQYDAGGVAYGIATAADDEAYRREILASAPLGARIVADLREITDLVPLRSIPFTGSIERGTRTIWVAGLLLPEPADLAATDPAIAACVSSIEPENYEFLEGAARLYSAACPGPKQ